MEKRALIREDAPEPSVSALDDARRRRELDEVTRAHGPYLRGLAHKLCRSQLDPDDLVQDVLEKTLHHPIPDGANPRAWLARVLHNLFIDKLRRKHARREDLVPEPANDGAGGGGESRVWWESLTEEVVRAQLANLPAEQRTTFELFAFAGKSYDEIAAELGIAKATVGTRILRARQKLRALLTEERGDG
jgi:RNA polymerase sigma-70 factor (ECF subfamily)